MKVERTSNLRRFDWVWYTAFGLVGVATLARIIAGILCPEAHVVTHCEAGDLLALAVLLVGIWGIPRTLQQLEHNREQLCLNRQQMSQSHHTEKAKFFKDLYLEMFRAPDIRKAYYQIEYGEFVYDEGFHGSQQERLLDRLLGFVNLVCDLRRRRSITEDDMQLFKYEFARIYQDQDVGDYLRALDNLYPSVLRNSKPFPAFRDYCKARKLGDGGGEKAKWEPNSLKRNLARMLPVVERAAGSDFRDDLERDVLRGVPGALHETLARLSSVGNAYPGARFYGKLIGEVAAPFQPCNAKEIIELLSPFFDWEFGTYGLERGLAYVASADAGRLLRLEPESGPALVEAVWLIGLVDIIGDLRQECVSAAAKLKRKPLSTAPRRSAYDEVIHEGTERIDRFAQDHWDLRRPQQWCTRRVRLWQNAVAMAKHRHEDEGSCYLGVFKELLKHVVEAEEQDKDEWPLPCCENTDFKRQYEAEVESFARPYLGPDGKPPNVLGDTATVEFLCDPLEVLNVGNVFSTCLRLARKSDAEDTGELLGWATNVNVRVGAVKRRDEGWILARRTLGLSLEEPNRVLQGPTCPPGAAHFKQHIDDFVNGFVSQHPLEPLYKEGASVKRTCAPSYNNDWLESPEA